jgi:hypothetical protein
MNIRKIAITGAVALALVAGGTAAGAVALSPSGTVYKGCIEGTSRVLEHVYTRANPPPCPSGSFAATWNQVGQSTAGPSGLDLTVSQTTVRNASGGTASAALCPSAEPHVVSGGYTITQGSGIVEQSFPTSADGVNGWEVAVTGESHTYSYKIYATCSK